MGLLYDYTNGVGSPRPKWQHQRTMSRLLGNSYYELQRKGLEMLTEATITNDWNDKAPDLVIFDNLFRPLSIFEITRSEQLDAIIDKCEELMERFPQSEYFVYDYENEVLYMYDAEYDRWLSSEENVLYSRYLSKPLQTYFEN
ncbi:MAG: hypothetical protein IJ834_01830 [Paludibacteraceae bacterium]|nr:hypothetical protein [Paludibacteraceae bacterium]